MKPALRADVAASEARAARGRARGPTFIGIHIPKCAGTTLWRRVAAGLPAEQFYQNSDIVENFRAGRPDFLEIEQPGKLRFLFGHSIHEEMLKLFPEPVFFTGLRDPVARLRSHITFRHRMRLAQGRPSDIQSFARVANPMCRALINCCPQLARRASGDSQFQKAKRVLEACSFVYFTDTFDAAATPICRALGIEPSTANANVSREGEPVTIDERLFDIADDRALYDWGRERFAGVDVASAIAEGTRVPAPFLHSAFRLGDLRTFLVATQIEQYERWKVLDAVIARKGALLANLEAELDAYAAARWEIGAAKAVDPLPRVRRQALYT